MFVFLEGGGDRKIDIRKNVFFPVHLNSHWNPWRGPNFINLDPFYLVSGSKETQKPKEKVG